MLGNMKFTSPVDKDSALVLLHKLPEYGFSIL